MDQYEIADFPNCSFAHFAVDLVLGEFNNYDPDTEIAVMVMAKVDNTLHTNLTYYATLGIDSVSQKFKLIIEAPYLLSEGNFFATGADYDNDGYDDLIITSHGGGIHILKVEP
jgi:hypothetical protein